MNGAMSWIFQYGGTADNRVIGQEDAAALFGHRHVQDCRDQRRNLQGRGTTQWLVSARAAANKAVEVTRGVGGVKSVKNGMRIK
jgi:hypothetical protein